MRRDGQAFLDRRELQELQFMRLCWTVARVLAGKTVRVIDRR